MHGNTVVLIPGDGIGPEVVHSAQKVMEAAGAGLSWVEKPAGASAVEHGCNDVLPAETLDAITHYGVALKGPVTTPIGTGFASVNVQLRKKLNLYAAVRPVRSMPGIKTRYENVDLVVVRENTEGLYSGIENTVAEGVVTSLKVATETACTRIARYAFKYAIERNRKKVTAFHKANIMKLTDGMFIRCAKKVHDEEFPQIAYEELIIDAASMRLIQDPSRFDIILCENLYGDILSDMCAALVGGLGVVPGANIGEKAAVFEAVHGSAPDIAGKGIANPLACIMSAVMMLNHIGKRDVAAKIKTAYNAVLSEGKTLTRDLGGTASTVEFTHALIERL